MTPFFSSENIDVYIASIVGGDEARSLRERQTVAAMLQEIFGCDTKLSHTDSGAPFIEGSHAAISISHSRQTAALAVSRDGTSVGLDIEGERTQLAKVAPRVLSDKEMASYGSSLSLLTTAWTLKEAAYKCAGIPGLDFRRDIELPSAPLQEAEISVLGKKMSIAFSGLIGDEHLSVVYLK